MTTPQPDRNAPVGPSASRPSPDRVAPVTIGGVRDGKVRYEAVFGSSKGRVRAVDAKSGAELWALDLYETAFVPMLETDVQERYLISLEKESDRTLLAKDEGDRVYRIDVVKRSAAIAVWPVSLRAVSSRPLSVELVISNPQKRTLALDKPSVAFGGELSNDLFEVTADGKPVPYRGMMAKRGRPKDFLTLKPLGEYQQAVDLSKDYDVPAGARRITVRFRHHNQFSPDDADLVSRPLVIETAR